MERLEHRTGLLCLPVSSGTSGLAVALAAVKRPGRALVILPSFTFAALPGVIRWAGLEPVFVDVERDGWHVDPVSLEEALAVYGGDTAAVMVGSSFGVPPPHAQTTAWQALTAEYNVPLIVDSAAGFGSQTPEGRELGAQGDVEVFSFHATKPFAVGEGGLLTTRNEAIHDRLLTLINFGFDSDRVVAGPAGTNAKLSEIQAATALAVLDRFDMILEHRRTLAAEYHQALRESGWVMQTGASRAAWQFIPTLAPTHADRVSALERCRTHQIETRAYYDPLHLFPGFSRFKRIGDLDATRDIAERTLSLPLSNRMDKATAAYVAGVVAGYATAE